MVERSWALTWETTVYTLLIINQAMKCKTLGFVTKCLFTDYRQYIASILFTNHAIYDHVHFAMFNIRMRNQYQIWRLLGF